MKPNTKKYTYLREIEIKYKYKKISDGKNRIWIIKETQKGAFGPILTHIPQHLLLGIHVFEQSVPEKDIAQVGFVPPDELEKVQYLSED